MTSSKLSHRRAIAKKPPICIPPPPPPGTWPPQRFDLRFIADWTSAYGPIHLDLTFHLERTGPADWIWADALFPPGQFHYATFEADPATDQAQLLINGYAYPDNYVANNINLSLIAHKTSYYQITTWTTVAPADLIASASFWF